MTGTSPGTDPYRNPYGQASIPAIPGYRDLVLHRRGSSAEVYRATMERLDRTVAIKLLRLDELTTYQQFQQELETAMRLSVQPHVVRILDTGAVDGRPYLAMEFCQDGSYSEIVANHGPLSIADAVDVGTKIAEALHAAHDAGIIHRDVTPGNVLRSKFGPALTDFGIARRPGELYGTVTLNKLTPHHAAPEALLRQPQSVRSDVYSLGSTLWHLLVGHPPYAQHGERNPDPFIYRDLALHRPVPLLPRPDVPVWLQTEIARAMAKQPDDRHPNAAAFGEALRRGWEAWKGRPWHPPTSYPPLPPPNGENAPAGFAPPAGDGAAPAPSGLGTRAASAGHGIEAAPAGGAGTPTFAAPAGSVADAAAEDGYRRPGSPGAGVSPHDAMPAAPYRTPGHRRRFTPGRVAGRLVAAAVGVVLGIGLIVALQWLPGEEERPTGRGKAPPATAEARVSAEKAPTDVAIEDQGSVVVISWIDNTGNTAPHYIVGGPSDASPRAMAQVEKGVTEVSIKALEPDTNYCFTVIAVISVDEVAPSTPACTERY
ncbi:MAG: protein kinase domain-containing protein [Micromonosporaceae bacterium]